MRMRECHEEIGVAQGVCEEREKSREIDKCTQTDTQSDR